ncbi:MAG: peptide ABC transporter substrate-binding protein [Microthrixaceae bacterium]|nr:peptide ABC transporter substrate-binding protein [Microthrixaceae bacterium]
MRQRLGSHSTAGRSVAALALAFTLLASGCGDSEDSGTGDTDGGATTETTLPPSSDDCRTLTYEDAPEGGEFVDYAQLASAGDNTSFDPGAVQTLDESQITNALFDGLTDFDFTDTCNPELKPLVAESYESNDDATVFTFKIKEGQKFHNGEPVLPHNFKQGWERAGSQELASSYGYLMAYLKGGADLLEGKVQTLDSIVADDDAMTLEVTLESALADFPAIASFSAFSPIADEDIKRVGNTTGWGDKGAVIGNGPFKFVSAGSPDNGEVVLERNDDWAGNVLGDKKAKLDKITFKLTTDVESAYTAFDSGEGDNASIPGGKYAEATAKYPNDTKSPQLGTYFFDFGFEDSNLGGDENLKLRQAISMAIDRDEINQKAYEGARIVSTGITPPGIPGFKADIGKYAKTDAAEAKKLYDEWVAEGGKLDGPIKLDFNTGGSHQTVVEIMQANLKDVLGIDVELNGIDEDYFKVIAEEGACHICRSGWYADYPTYGNFMVDLFGAVSIGGNNLGRYDDPTFEKHIANALKETDPTKRGEFYQQAEEQLLNESVAAIPLNWYTGDHVFRDTVINYDQQPLGNVLWEKVGKKQ